MNLWELFCFVFNIFCYMLNDVIGFKYNNHDCTFYVIANWYVYIVGEEYSNFFWWDVWHEVWNLYQHLSTNETGPLPLCTFSVMGLSMCSSIFSESSPVRSKSGIINELSGLPNSVPTVRCSYTSFSWYGHTGHAYCICFVGKH